jgi:hypothetical protein
LTGKQFADQYQYNDWNWANEAAEFGSADNFYYEDNALTGPACAAVACGQGNRYAVRHNTITNTGDNVFWMFDMHGTYGDGLFSSMIVEVYNNTIDSDYAVGSLDQRGGMALFYNNIFTCAGVAIQIRNEYDLNADLIAPVTATNGESKRIHKSYYWGNRNNDELVEAVIAETANYGSPLGQVPQFNRDCFDEDLTFDGTTGVGVGLLAARPATCTTGVGYWATDTKTLYRASATNTWEVFYKPYTYPHPLRRPLNLTVPNGGESWATGSTHSISWTTGDYEGTVSLSLFRNGIKTFDIGTAPASDRSFSWTLPGSLSTGGGYAIKIAGGSNEDVSEAPFFIVSASTPVVSLNRTTLNFGAAPNVGTSSQKVFLRNAGNGVLNWTASSSQPWLRVTPTSGSGNAWLTVSVDPAGLAADTYWGTIGVRDPADPGSPRYVTATLRVYNSGALPFGSFDSPADNTAGVVGSLPVSGWALDDIEVANVKIYRDPVTGEGGNLVYIGDAVFVDGARPDVETTFPEYPLSSRGGWGYMLLTNMLPGQGNGPFTLYARATDREGHVLDLGTKTFHCNNANAALPFGAIDAPSQGGTAFGAVYYNFGWVLTPRPNLIPIDGSTIWVFVDGVPLGHPIYNDYRSDIATIFPLYTNANGAGGHFAFNTSAFADGLHTIAWGVRDNAGNETGIGSRFFSIENDSSPLASQSGAIGMMPIQEHRETWAVNAGTPIRVRRGFARNEELHYSNLDGAFTIDLRLGEPVSFELDPDGISEFVARERSSVSPPPFSGFQCVGENIRNLPAGSHLDPDSGVFSWLPGPGFAGVFQLEFSRAQRGGAILRWTINARVGRG